ncbi:hypothetical protein GALMADRAFT_707406 [Galerina marginata CBS 339.88]|uniref:Secreted protein n=1 Tax=Galerina marginata (strain CBS 339.88) TaxID=685588 RepID=A0A067TMB1_GALM3|nr:hypothetical protein GALMADRAFT_707406 [Galerina marginata CBS 339.88]
MSGHVPAAHPLLLALASWRSTASRCAGQGALLAKRCSRGVEVGAGRVNGPEGRSWSSGVVATKASTALGTIDRREGLREVGDGRWW